jgi:SAM-dependent methyltransferase
MQETFLRESAANPEPFTGERLTASIHGQVEIEHYHRYLFSRGFCRDQDVLDVASGEGYGAAQLAQVARQVVGVEYSEATVRNASANFPKPNLRFIQGDARSLPLADASVDVVTSFETIEHFDRQDEFVAEVRRVLRPDGCFIVSTPDRDIYSPPGSTPNPFHVREFDRTEFLDLLHHHFQYVSLIRQRPLQASGLFPEEVTAISPLIFERVDEQCFSSATTLQKAPYLIAIATRLAPRLAPISLFVERSDLDNVRFADQQAEPVRLRFAEMATREAAEAARDVALEAARVANEAAEKAQLDARNVAEQALEDARKAIEEAREAARIAVQDAQRKAEQSETRAQAAAVTLTHTRAVLDQANTDLDRLSGSARQFIRQYLPRLRRHLFR